MTQAVLSISDAHLLSGAGAMMLTDFKQVQASVFQVARAPGQEPRLPRRLLLIVGVFAMLYVRERRLWVWLRRATTTRAPRPPSRCPRSRKTSTATASSSS